VPRLTPAAAGIMSLLGNGNGAGGARGLIGNRVNGVDAGGSLTSPLTALAAWRARFRLSPDLTRPPRSRYP
jgi:hypothetical protein